MLLQVSESIQDVLKETKQLTMLPSPTRQLFIQSQGFLSHTFVYFCLQLYH